MKIVFKFDDYSDANLKRLLWGNTASQQKTSI